VRTLVAQARSFSICGRFDEAIVRCELALHLDPFSAVARAEREKILQCAKISQETKREPDRPAGEALIPSDVSAANGPASARCVWIEMIALG
jgi:hypothetical protein